MAPSTNILSLWPIIQAVPSMAMLGSTLALLDGLECFQESMSINLLFPRLECRIQMKHSGKRVDSVIPLPLS